MRSPIHALGLRRELAQRGDQAVGLERRRVQSAREPARLIDRVAEQLPDLVELRALRLARAGAE